MLVTSHEFNVLVTSIVVVVVLEIQKMKQEVVKEIRANGQLESDLNEMDIKIGLLVKNRITLQVALPSSPSLN